MRLKAPWGCNNPYCWDHVIMAVLVLLICFSPLLFGGSKKPVGPGVELPLDR